MAKPGARLSRAMVVGPAHRFVSRRRLASACRIDRVCRRRTAIQLLGDTVPVCHFEGAGRDAGLVCRRRSCRGGGLPWLSTANTIARATRLDRHIDDFPSIRARSFEQSECRRRVHFCKHSVSRFLVGPRVSSHAESMVSPGSTLGLELGAGLCTWVAGQRLNNDQAYTVALLISLAFIWRTRLVAATPEMLKLTSEENPVASLRSDSSR